MSGSEREADRIRAEYARRARELDPDLYSSTRPANLFLFQGQQRALLSALTTSRQLPLAGKSILEVGCGTGRWIAAFEQFGAAPEQLAGVDLDEARVQLARARYPHADLRAADATRLPWPNASFDIVFQSLVFTSILDEEMRTAVAREMRRVLKETGVILWYDFSYNNPTNPNVRGIRGATISRLFPGTKVTLQRVTLAPPITRRLVPLSWLAAAALEKARLLNTHLFGVITPL